MRGYREEPEDYVTEVEGRILRITAEEKHFLVGKISAMIVHVAEADDGYVSLAEVFDCVDSTLASAYEAVFIPDTSEYRETLSLEGDGHFNGRDLLLISKVEILPRYRGKGYGRFAVRRMLKTLGSGLAMALLEAHPVRYSQGAAQTDDWEGRMRVTEFEGKTAEGVKKLRRYWTGLGFTPIEGTDFYFFDLARAVPMPKRMIAAR